MAEYAERVVVELRADTTDHDTRIRNSATVVDQSATRIERSANRAEAAIRSSSQGMVRGFDAAGQRSRLLGFQIADVGSQLAAGTSPFLILAQQAPQVANAMDGTAGAAGRLATFFSGPWGAALLAAGSVLGVLLFRTREHAETVEQATQKLDRNARQAEVTRRAHEAFGRTLPGIAAAIREETERLEEQNRTLGENQRLMLDRARQHKQTLESDLNANLRAQVEVNRRIRVLEEQRATAGDPRIVTQELAAQQTRLRELQRRNAELRATIADAEQEIREAQIPIIQSDVETGMDAAAAATRRYEEALASLNEQLRRNQINELEYQSRLRTAAERRDREIEAAREAERRRNQRPDADNTQFRLPVQGRVAGRFGENRGDHTHGGVDLAVPVGTNVGAAAAGTVIEIGNLPGYGNTVIIDHGRGTTTRYAHLSQILAQRGQRVGQGDVIGLSGGARGAPGAGNSRGPHVHFEVRRSGRPVAFGQGRFPTDTAEAGDAAIERLARETEQRAQREAAFQDELAQLDERLLQSRQRGVASAEERFTLEQQELESARQRQNAAYEEAERQGRITDTQRQSLVAKNDELFLQLEINSQLQEWQRLDEQQYQIALSELQTAQSLEQARGQLSRTVAQRRESEMRLLDMSEKEELLAIERLRNQQGLNDAERKRLDREEAAVRERYGYARQAVEQRNMTPLQQYLDRIPQTADEINEALESVAASGLDRLNQGITDAIMGARSLGEAFGQVADQIIADLIRIAIQQAIVGPLAGALFGGGKGGGFFGSLFGGFRAGGGPVQAGVPYFVGEKGRELFVPDRDGQIIPNGAIPAGRAQSASTGRATMPAPHITVISAPQFDLRGMIGIDKLFREVDRVSKANAAAAAAAMGRGVLKAVPGRLDQYQTDGV